jgi:hypothetical protein
MYIPTAVFDNRREKTKWAITPFLGLALIFIFCMVPMAWFVGRNTREMVAIFYTVIIPLSAMGFWYLLSIPSFIVMDQNFILFDRCTKKELIPTINIVKITRFSRGILYLKFRDGKERIKEGIDDAIIYYLVTHMDYLNLGG